MKRKKVIIFINSIFGGVERITITVGKVFRNLGYNVKFYIINTPWTGKENVSNSLKNDAFKYEIIPWHYLIIKMFKVILRDRPNYVFSSHFAFNVKLCEIRKYYPFFNLIIRNNLSLAEICEDETRKVKSFYRYADAIILQTEEMMREMEEIGVSGACQVIPNPIDEDVMEKCIQDPNPFVGIKGKTLVAVGRFAEQKDYNSLIHAFELVLKKHRDAILYIVGQNDGVYETYYNEVSQLIDNLNLKEKVVCTGFKQNPWVYIKNADCFVLSSLYEGYPNVVNEALYCGTPIAAFNCVPVIGRIVKDGEYGYVVEEHSPEALSDAIIQALDLKRYNCEVNSNSKALLAELISSLEH